MNGLGRASRVADVALLVLVGAPACQRDYRFRTTARYESPAMLYRLEIEASGLVRAGHDVSQRAQAVVQFIPGAASTGRRVRVYVTLPDELTYEVEGGGAGVGAGWTRRATPASRNCWRNGDIRASRSTR